MTSLRFMFKHGALPCLILVALCYWLSHKRYLVAAQAVSQDAVDFTAIAIWNDLRSCLQDCLDGWNDIASDVQCSTNACFCRADTLGLAVEEIGPMVMSACSDIQDTESATSILTAYYAAKGSTSIIQPTDLPSTGASTVTVDGAAATVTQYAYETVYVKVSEATASLQKPLLTWFLLCLFSAVLL